MQFNTSLDFLKTAYQWYGILYFLYACPSILWPPLDLVPHFLAEWMALKCRDPLSVLSCEKNKIGLQRYVKKTNKDSRL